MTVQPMGPGTDVAVPQADMLNTGLDDMTQADLSIPRLRIINKEGMFQDSLSNNKVQQMNVIILGLVKQRTLWPAKVPQGQQSKPMCRSNDFQQGFVNLKQTISPFPYDVAQLTQAHVQPRDDGQLVFNCADCKLKEWGSHPLGDKPYCNEIWSLLLMMDPAGTGQYLPAVLNLSKTNITPAKHYLGGFKAAETAAFTAYTTISLQLLRRGDNDYSNITFQRAGTTDSSNWAEWSSLYLEMRNFITREPRVFEDDQPSGPPSAPVAQPVAAQPMAAPQPAPVAQPAPVVQPAAQTVIVQPEPAPVAADPNAPVDPWSQPGVTVDPAPVQPQQPMQAPPAVAQEPVPQAAPPAPAPAPVAQPAPVAEPASVAPPAPAPVAPAPVTPPAPAAVPTPAPAPAPQAVASAPQPAPSQVAPAPAPTVSAPVPTSPAVPAASVPAAPGDDNDDLPF